MFNTDGEFQAAQLQDLLNRADTALLAEKLSRCVDTGHGLTFSWQTSTGTGSERFQTTLIPFKDPTGDQTCVFATAVVIADEDKAENGLSLLQLALDKINETAMIVDRDARILYANGDVSRMLGFTRQQLLSMSIHQLDPNWPAERWPEIWSRLIDQDSLCFESNHRTEDNRILAVEITASHLKYQGQDYAFALARDISERQRIEKELHARSEEFRILVEHSPDLIVRYDRACRRTYANPAFVNASQRTLEALLGNTPTEQQVLLTEPGAYEAKIKEVLATGQTTDLTFSWHNRDGAESWSHARFVPERNSDGSIASVMVINHDVTSLKRTERQLETLIDNIPDMVFRFDVDGRQLYVNPTVCETFGLEEENFLGKPPAGKDIDGKPLVESIRKAANTGTPNRREFIRSTDKGNRHFTVQHVPEQDQNGRVTSVLGIATDVTELLQAQLALRESESRYRQIFDNTQESLFLLESIPGGQFRLLQVNPAFEKAIATKADSLIGKTLNDALASDAATAMKALVDHCLSTGDVVEKERTLDFGHGPRTYHATLIPVRDDAGEIKRLVGMIRDITERLESERAMKRLNRALKTLSSGNEALVRATNEGELLENMCNVVVEIGGYHTVWIGYSDNQGRLRPVAWAGDETLFQVLQQYHQYLPEVADPASVAVQTGRARVVHDIESLPECAPFRETFKQGGIKACVAFPLSSENATFGVLTIYSTDNNAYDEQEVDLLKEMADDLSYGIHTLHVRGEKERFVERLKESMESTIQALASTVELRDPYTAGHQHRVAELAMAVCRRLHWPEEKIQATYLAGLVHDIGKIAIPAEILSKPGHLNQAEYTLVRTHAEAGFDILKSVDFNWPIAQIVLQHHERLDGSGYPYGLVGEAILSEARVLSVCDVVEAMTTHRPYRPGLGIEAAIAEIEQGRNRLYDAAIVDACIQVIREQNFQFNS